MFTIIYSAVSICLINAYTVFLLVKSLRNPEWNILLGQSTTTGQLHQCSNLLENKPRVVRPQHRWTGLHGNLCEASTHVLPSEHAPPDNDGKSPQQSNADEYPRNFPKTLNHQPHITHANHAWFLLCLETTGERGPRTTAHGKNTGQVILGCILKKPKHAQRFDRGEGKGKKTEGHFYMDLSPSAAGLFKADVTFTDWMFKSE